jgi:hypothetical protein
MSMTPKEKAFSLYFKYIRDVIADNEKAKQCAIIAVDEIIKFGNQMGIREPMMYWHDVKQEIEKL